MTLTATTLAADLGADDLVMTLTAAMSTDSHERGFVVQIEAEYILVERRVARTNPQIVRGFLGTERAAHDSGEDVTPVVLVAQTDPPVEPPTETPGGGGGGVTVTVPPDDPVAVTNITAAGATIDGDTATLGVTTLTDPGALWEAEHEYAEGDRILALGSIVMEAKEDGLSGTDEPSWDSVANVFDGDIAWRALGEIGDIPASIMPFGARAFAYTSPSVIAADAQERVDIHAADAAAHATAIADAITAHNIASPAHGIYTGTLDPTQGAGVAASPGSLYLTNLPGANGGAVFVKEGDADTAWSRLDIVA